MDQGSQPVRVPRRVAQGYFGLIFFIVLSLALVGGYAWLVPVMLQKSQDLKTMESKIKDTIDDPLRRMGAMLPLEQKQGGSTLTYGGQYFSKLADLAKQGVAYSTLVTKVGYGTGPSAPAVIDSALAGSGSNATSLKELIDGQTKELASLKSNLGTTQKSLDSAQTQVQAKMDELASAQKAYQKQLAKLETTLDEERRKSEAALDDVKKKLDESQTAWKELWDKTQASEKAAKDAAAQQQATIEGQDQQVAELREELKGKQPGAKLGPFGTVLECDLVHRFCMLDRGARDGVKQGEQLLVYREGLQNKMVEMGKVVVVRVYNDSSRADIVLQNEMKPIGSGDMLYVTPPEGAESKTSAAAPVQ